MANSKEQFEEGKEADVEVEQEIEEDEGDEEEGDIEIEEDDEDEEEGDIEEEKNEEEENDIAKVEDTKPTPNRQCLRCRKPMDYLRLFDECVECRSIFNMRCIHETCRASTRYGQNYCGRHKPVDLDKSKFNKCAYCLNLHGFQGTYCQNCQTTGWTCQGPTGFQGPTGEQGVTGFQGACYTHICTESCTKDLVKQLHVAYNAYLSLVLTDMLLIPPDITSIVQTYVHKDELDENHKNLIC